MMASSDFISPNLFADTLAMAHGERRGISRELFRSVLAAFEVVADLVACIAGALAASAFCVSIEARADLQFSGKEAVVFGVAMGVLVVFLLHRDGAYSGGGSLLGIRETERALRIPAQTLAVLLPFLLLLTQKSWLAVLPIALAVASLLLILRRRIFESIVHALHSRGYGVERVVVFGAGECARKIASALLYSPRLGFRPVAILNDDSASGESNVVELGYRRRGSVPVYPGPVTPSLLESFACSLLIVAIPGLSSERFSAISSAAELAGLRVAVLTASELEDSGCVEIVDVDGLLMAVASRRSVPLLYAILKRAMDLVLASLLLLLLAPLLLIVAVLIRLDSPGAAIFAQKRVGLKGRLFEIYKFRTMHRDALKYEFSPASSSDVRITRIGRLLRKTSLDELPQLLNVLRGEMSLVGPRPEMPFIVKDYDLRHRQRLLVTPGITGMWQLSGDRGRQIHLNLEYDLYYIRNRSFFMDVAVLAHTLFFAIHGI